MKGNVTEANILPQKGKDKTVFISRSDGPPYLTLRDCI